MTIFSVQELWVATFDLFIILQKTLVIDEVLEGFPNFIEIYIVIILDLLVNLFCILHYVMCEQLEALYFCFAGGARSCRACGFE